MPHLFVVGGSDAGIAAALTARTQDPGWDVTVALADRYPNFSICGLPFYLSGETPDWRDLAHRTTAQLAAAGINLAVETTVIDLEPAKQRVTIAHGGECQTVSYDEVIVATGAMPARPPLPGIDLAGVHTLHTMADAFAVHDRLGGARRVVIVGAGYIGCELADAYRRRHLDVTVIEALPEVLPTVDDDLGRRVRDELTSHGVRVLVGTAVSEIHSARDGLSVRTAGGHDLVADIVTVAVGVAPNTALGGRARLALGVRARSGSIGEWRPASPTSGRPVTASRRGFRSGTALATSRSAPPPTNKAASPVPTLSAASAGSPALSAPKSCKSSISPSPAPASAMTKPVKPATSRASST